jgi:hypothetical protein
MQVESQNSGAFPPYQLLAEGYLREGERKSEKLIGIYRKTQSHSWDGEKILAELIEKHGPIKIDRQKRVHLAELFSVLMWGELAAWNIAADLALELNDVDAKMAATGQVFDEARHFHTLRSYLKYLDVEIPKLDAYTVILLRTLLEEKVIAHKILGMQLLVENIASNLFRAISELEVEPVLCDLLPYFVRDESRHVGLGVTYLPRVVSDYGRFETFRFRMFEGKINILIGWAGRILLPHIEGLGIDYNALNRDTFRMYSNALHELTKLPDGRPAKAIVAVTQQQAEEAIDLFIPLPGSELPAWRKNIIDRLDRAAQIGNRMLTWLVD